jgi:hypothetical protein
MPDFCRFISSSFLLHLPRRHFQRAMCLHQHQNQRKVLKTSNHLRHSFLQWIQSLIKAQLKDLGFNNGFGEKNFQVIYCLVNSSSALECTCISSFLGFITIVIIEVPNQNFLQYYNYYSVGEYIF